MAQSSCIKLSIREGETHNAGSSKMWGGYSLVYRGHACEFQGSSTRVRNQKLTLMSELGSCLCTSCVPLDLWQDGFSCCGANCALVLVVKNLSADAGDIKEVGSIPWRRKWQPIPVFLPGQSHGQRSLASYSPQGYKESDMTEVTWHVNRYWSL